MATEEYLHHYIEGGKRYEDLPSRLRMTLSEEDWKRKVKSYCISRGFSWSSSLASSSCPESEYYESLVQTYSRSQRLFPYHLSEYVCRVQRLMPFDYYVEMLTELMVSDRAYDALPNFVAADALRLLGVGRNEFIALLVKAKSARQMWRSTRATARAALPRRALPLALQAWWRLHAVNVSDVEWRALSEAEQAVMRRAAAEPRAGLAGLEAGELLLDGAAEGEEAAVKAWLGSGPTPHKCFTSAAFPANRALQSADALHAKGLLWVEVPVRGGDQVSVPPLEGFVSNRTTQGEALDPVEALLYQVFVAASDRSTVRQLAHVLGVDPARLRVALSVGCRLGFCARAEEGEEGVEASLGSYSLRSRGGLGPDSSGQELDFGAFQGSGSVASAAPAAPAPPPSAALIVDARVTGFLMMGALTPACKRHSVTLFEGGRVHGAEAVAELQAELATSLELARELEGDMASLVATARALHAVLKVAREAVGERGSVELLRKESLEGLPVDVARRALRASYSAAVVVAGLPPPALPLPAALPGPALYGPSASAGSAWALLALASALGDSPSGLALCSGRALLRLPAPAARAAGAVVRRWGKGEAVWVPRASLLASLNAALRHGAVLLWVVGEGDTRAARTQQEDEEGRRCDSGKGEEGEESRRCDSGKGEEGHRSHSGKGEEGHRSHSGKGSSPKARAAPASLSDAPSVEEALDVLDVPLPLRECWELSDLRSSPAEAEEERAPTTLLHRLTLSDSPSAWDDASDLFQNDRTKGDDAFFGQPVDGFAVHWPDQAGGAAEAEAGNTEPPPSPSASLSPALPVRAFDPRTGSEKQILLPRALLSGLASLGLARALGVLRVVRLQERWAPMGLELGVPLQPPALCEAVCAAAAEAAFLQPEACARHREGMRLLEERLEALSAAFGAGGAAAGEADWTLGAGALTVDLAVGPGGEIRACDLGNCLQGVQRRWE